MYPNIYNSIQIYDTYVILQFIIFIDFDFCYFINLVCSYLMYL